LIYIIFEIYKFYFFNIRRSISFIRIELIEEDVETIGGVVLKKLGKIAEVGDEVSVDNHSFTVKSIEGPRILKISIKKIDLFPETKKEGDNGD